MRIELEAIVVRHWRVTDLASLVHHANNERIARNVRDTFPHPYSEADGQQWLALATGDRYTTTFAIEIDGQAVGGIGLLPMEDVYRKTAEIGYWLGEAYWGRGIMSRVLRATTAYAFATFDLIRIEAGVFSWNPASARVLEKAGYSLEATNKRAVFKQGQILDRQLYAIFRP
jgi:RimJ/RimL family protein N-acetyltransferase